MNSPLHRTWQIIVSCAYKPEVQRSYGWRPPAGMIEQLRSNGVREEWR